MENGSEFRVHGRDGPLGRPRIPHAGQRDVPTWNGLDVFSYWIANH